MYLNGQDAEKCAVFNVAAAMCAAARTAPKSCGIDHIETAVLSGPPLLMIGIIPISGRPVPFRP